jgi:hypothetical protein
MSYAVYRAPIIGVRQTPGQKEYLAMCDYSLRDVASRPAQVGDKLITHKFPSCTSGFTGICEPNVAVCLMPGTELAFEENVTYSHPLSLLPWFRFGEVGANMARFRQINMGQQFVHHDALEFGNGKVVLLTRLHPDQRATVLQLPATHQPATTEVVEHRAGAAID